MKDKIITFKRGISLLIISVCLVLAFSVGVWADGAEKPENPTDSGEYTEVMTDKSNPGGENVQNVFDQIYATAEENADKIFAGLAFIGTLVVSIGYKSGLLPLLRDALSKLKLAIDGVKADGELNKALTESRMNEISQTVNSTDLRLSNIEEMLEGYELIREEREAMRIILEGQIDMLYAIFMSSALPQYQKDEIGEKIKDMREELASCESIEE